MPRKATSVAALAVAALAGSASADLVPYSFNLTLRHSSGFELSLPTKTMWLETRFESADDGTENPLAVDEMEWVESAAQNDISSGPSTLDVLRVRFDFEHLPLSGHLHSEGIVHRDIAARNVLIETTGGTFSSDAGAQVLFGSDAPRTLAGENIGPVRWMAPESIRATQYDPGATGGSAEPGEFWEIAAFSHIDVDYSVVPAPGAAALLAGGVLITARRRR